MLMVIGLGWYLLCSGGYVTADDRCVPDFHQAKRFSFDYEAQAEAERLAKVLEGVRVVKSVTNGQ